MADQSPVNKFPVIRPPVTNSFYCNPDTYRSVCIIQITLVSGRTVEQKKALFQGIAGPLAASTVYGKKIVYQPGRSWPEEFVLRRRHRTIGRIATSSFNKEVVD
jgi:Tautomerase enzyme